MWGSNPQPRDPESLAPPTQPAPLLFLFKTKAVAHLIGILIFPSSRVKLKSFAWENVNKYILP